MKRRIIKTSILICCEGKTEVAFSRYIKNLYIDGKRKYVLPKLVGGGGLKSIKNTIDRYEKHSAFNQYYGLLDGDLISMSENPEANILITEPCIEGFFLELLGHNKPSSSKDCKKQFEEQYLNEKEKLDHRNYGKIFNKDLLEEKREINILLNKILKIFE